nr:hypothetical protein Iba_chr02dCG4520 [Ipomoea batatas]
MIPSKISPVTTEQYSVQIRDLASYGSRVIEKFNLPRGTNGETTRRWAKGSNNPDRGEGGPHQAAKRVEEKRGVSAPESESSKERVPDPTRERSSHKKRDVAPPVAVEKTGLPDREQDMAGPRAVPLGQGVHLGAIHFGWERKGGHSPQGLSEVFHRQSRRTQDLARLGSGALKRAPLGGPRASAGGPEGRRGSAGESAQGSRRARNQRAWLVNVYGYEKAPIAMA